MTSPFKPESAAHAPGPPTEQGVTSALEGGARGMSRVYVWDIVVRVTHWGLALSLAVLAVTGIYLGDPFLLAPGEAGRHFATGWMRAVHFYAAIVFSLSLLSRLWWMVAGTYFARWHQFFPVAAIRRKQMIDSFLFYIFLRRDPPENVIGHNPLAAAAYLGVYALELFMVVSGLALYGLFAQTGPFAAFAGLLPLLGGAQVARLLHHIVMWLLIGFFIQHLYSALLTTHLEKNGTLESIFSGWKWFRTPKSTKDE